MVKRLDASADGMYHSGGAKYKMNRGSRAQVWHKTALKTAGGLTRSQLKMNKHGRIVSLKKSKSNPLKRLTAAGYKTKKGVFGSTKNGKATRKSKRGRSRKSKK
jgi:hypothetical protein